MNLVRKETYYEILGVPRNFELGILSSVYEAEIEFWTKIRNQGSLDAEERIYELTKAYDTLKDPVKKEKYDSVLDFEFVLLDGKTKDPEMEEAYDQYRTTHKKSYQEILGEFTNFKEELSDTLWNLKITTLYLVLNLLLYSGLVILFSIIENILSDELDQIELFRPYHSFIFLVLSLLGFQVFKSKYLKPTLKKRKEVRKKSKS